jgi:hypothetical protein
MLFVDLSIYHHHLSALDDLSLDHGSVDQRGCMTSIGTVSTEVDPFCPGTQFITRPFVLSSINNRMIVELSSIHV